ncbi:MAG: hypothetical protein EA362_07315 [Saprospirales bacterium]|nr:MAG: hypothetical protein EA362_07315 [Saprospirales bacterium]
MLASLRLPIVQGFLTERIANSIAENIGYEVSVQRVNFNFINKLEIDGLLILYESGDTLVYADRLRAGTSRPITSLFNRSLEINTIDLDGAVVKILNTPKDSFLLPKPNERESIDVLFHISLDALNFHRSRVMIEDSYKGNREQFLIEGLFLTAESIDLQKMEFQLSSLVLDGVVASSERFESLYMDDEPMKKEKTGESGKYFRPGFKLGLDFLEVRNSSFSSTDFLRKGEKGEHYKALQILDLDIQFDNVVIDSNSIRANPQSLSFTTSEGFELLEMKADELFFSDKNLEFRNVNLLSGGSFIDETISLTYGDLHAFRDFSNEVIIKGDFHRAEILISELLFLGEELGQSAFIQKNKDKTIHLAGSINGTLNDLNGKNIQLSIDDYLNLKGNFFARNITVPGEEFFRLQVEDLNTDIFALKGIIPEFEIPPNFEKLQKLNFNGLFEGYLRDFEAEGILRTDIGAIATNVQLYLMDGIEGARYSGTLSVEDFNLGTWLENDEFEKINFFAELTNGSGLTPETVNAQIVAEVSSFSFRGYEYDSLFVDGFINRRVFDGYFSIGDEHLDFEMVGIVFYGDDEPRINADISLNKLHTRELNLSEENFHLSALASIDARGIDFDYPNGSLVVRDFVIEIPDSLSTNLDSLYLIATVDEYLNKRLIGQSDILDLIIEGNYRLGDLGDLIKRYALEHFEYSHKFFPDTIFVERESAKFDFDLQLKNTKGFTHLFLPQLDTIMDSRIWGDFDSEKNSYTLEFSFPELKIDNNFISGLYGYIGMDEQFGNVLITNNAMQLGPLFISNPTTLSADLSPSHFNFNLNTQDYQLLLDDLYIEGRGFLEDDKWAFIFANTNLAFLGEDWAVNDDNKLVLGEKFFRTKNLKFSSEDKLIFIESIADRGLNVGVLGLDLNFLNELINDQRYLLDGELNLDLWTTNIFEFDALNGQVNVNDFSFQGIDYGNLYLESSLITGTGLLEINMRNSHPHKGLLANGVISVDGEQRLANNRLMDVQLQLKDFPMLIFEKIVEDGVSDTEGTFDGNLRATAESWDQIELEGDALVHYLESTIEVLGVRYSAENQRVALSTNWIDFTGLELRDPLGNTATVEGGFRHRLFGDMRMDLTISSPRIMALNTSRQDNNLYYGRLIGQVDAEFEGSFQRPDIRINAINGPGSRLFILVNEAVQTSELDFIVFDHSEEQVTREFFSEVTGVNFLLDMTANEDAEVQIIFNEQTGDILSGRGNGNLQLRLTRNGDFTIFGDYEISEGNYLFANTFGLLQVNKPFDVLRGGTIQWTGDPLNAIIDIEANYSGLTAAPYNFIDDYLQTTTGDEQLINEANQSTPVDLTLMLTGLLVRPDINFSIDFPNLTGNLRTLTDRKILDLEDNPDEMNRQVFALIVIGGFLPSSFNIGFGHSVAAITNTFSEWISNQLSLYLTDLLSNAFEDVGFISGIEMDVGYMAGGEFKSVGQLSTSELRVGVRPTLFDGRVQMNVGGNYVRESFVTSDPYLAPYGVVDYFITPDRRWRLRMSSNLDYVPEGRRNRHSVGVLFRREFDSIEEFMHTVQLFQGRDKKGSSVEELEQ